MKRCFVKAASVALNPLSTAMQVLTGGADSSLYGMAVLRAAKEAIEEAEAALKSEANDEFRQLQTTEPLTKEFDVCDPTGVKIASVARYTPKTVWRYSTNIEKLALQLKTAQAKEQLDGTAKKLASTSDTMFALKL